MSHHQHTDKKDKKKALLKKNRFQYELFNFLRLRKVDEERVRDLEEVKKPKSAASPSPEWSDKVSTVRNRLTGKKRTSQERWNRFAGTESGGGRGL